MEFGYIILGILFTIAILVGGIVIIKSNDDDCIYVHIKTGNKYRIYTDDCKMKVAGNWVDSVIYISEKTCELYVREYHDFYKHFVNLEEWKKIK